MNFLEKIASVDKRLTSLERSQTSFSVDFGYITTVEDRLIKVSFAKDGGRYESDWLYPVSLPGITPSKPSPGMTAVCVIVGNQGVWLGLIQNLTNPPTEYNSLLSDKQYVASTEITSEADSIQVWKVPGQTLELNSTGLYLNGMRVRTL